jgi:NADH dehydrogenase
MLVTVFGGSGFLGRYVVRRLAKEGARVRVAVRRPELAGHVRIYGHVGQVVPVACNIRDDESVRDALRGADAAVLSVGTFDAKGRNSFQAIHVDAAERVARICLEQGVRRLVHVSALGAAETAGSEYARTKAAGEAAVLRHMPHAVILRPSVMFGQEDSFFNRFGAMASRFAVLPVVGANTLFQPVWVDDVAQVAAAAATGRVPPGLYELGGPEQMTFRELMERMLHMIRRRRLVVNLPFWLGNLMGSAFGLGQSLTGGLVKAPITRDQVASLRSHNVASAGSRGFEALGIAPTAMESVLPDYLWRFRPGGQYVAIQESARNLRT